MEQRDGEGRGEPRSERGGAAANDAGVATEMTVACDGQCAANNGGGDVQRTTPGRQPWRAAAAEKDGAAATTVASGVRWRRAAACVGVRRCVSARGGGGSSERRHAAACGVKRRRRSSGLVSRYDNNLCEDHLFSVLCRHAHAPKIVECFFCGACTKNSRVFFLWCRYGKSLSDAHKQPHHLGHKMSFLRVENTWIIGAKK